MPDTLELSETKQALFEKYLRGELSQLAVAADTSIQDTPESSVPPVSEDAGSALVPVVPLQTHGSRPPFFYLHVHVEGGAFYCFTLARHLGSDQPFYVLEPYRYDCVPVVPSLETMAAAYVESMRAVQPQGPYYLGGFCGGGLIAFEVAQQLRAAGQEVAFLLLIEPKDGPAPHRMRFRNALGDFVRRVGGLLRLSQGQQCDWYIFLESNYIYLRYVYDYLRIPVRRLQNSLGLGKAEHRELGRIGDKGGVAFPRRRSFGIVGRYTGVPSEKWLGKFVWMISHYVARQYPGKAFYFWARHTIVEEQRSVGKIEDGEVAEAKELESHVLPGYHMTLMNEHVHEMAERLKACLNEAQTAWLEK